MKPIPHKRSTCPTSNRPSLSARDASGFSLIISLMLMGFMLLLMLSLTALMRIETVVSTQSSAKEVARQNAYLGVVMALGELQKTTGPDQRTTARADIEEDPDRTETDTRTIMQPTWTGVWDKDGNLMTWLVSGNTYTAGTASGTTHTPQSAPDPATDILLVSERGSPDSGSGSFAVYAPKVELPEETGSFAYWIGDEGVKAKANRRVTTGTETNPDPANAELLAPLQLGVASMTDMAWLQSANQDRLTTLFGDSSLKVLSGSIANADTVSEHFDDLTVWSYGILSDSANGGLKKDLTAGFFGTNPTALSGSIFPSQGSATATATDPGGPDWAQLRSWAITLPNDDGELPVRPATNTQAGIYPVVTAAQLYFMPVFHTMTASTGGTGEDEDEVDSELIAPGEYPVYLYLMPAVVLWNPYDRPIQEEDYTVIFARTFRVDEVGSGADDKTVLGNPLRMVSIWLEYPSDSTKTRHHLALNRPHLAFTIPNVQLAPGEAKVYSPQGKALYSEVQQNTKWNPVGAPGGKNELHEGYDPAGVYYVKAKDYALGGNFEFNAEVIADPEASVDPANPNSDVIIPGYDWDLSNNGIVHSVYLAKGTDDEIEMLQELLLLRPGDGTIAGPSSMHSFLSNRSSALTTDPVGFKMVRTFTENTFTPAAIGDRPKWLASLNPRAMTQGSAGRQRDENLTGNKSSTRNSSIRYALLTDPVEGRKIDAMSSGSAYVGHDEDNNAVERAVLFEPSPGREGLWSIGQLMHAPLYRWEPSGTTYDTVDDRIDQRTQTGRFDNLMPAYAIGNSDASPFVTDVSQAFVQIPGGDSNATFNRPFVRYDYSYLLNEALWDSYFLSTLPANTVVSGTEPVNPRLVRYPNSNDSFTLAVDNAAENLMIDGSFNVNSTSVEAWKALLSSYFGATVTQRDGGSVANSESVPFIRTGAPVGEAIGPTGLDSGAQAAYDGYRRLNASEIENLAVEIVRQVRLRGPFTNLADFVNRTLDPSVSGLTEDEKTQLHLRGALAEAIRLSEINEELQDTEAEPLAISSTWANAEAGEGWSNEHVPGWLSQADIMSRLGSVLTARSDTFRIRSYGEYTPLDTGLHSKAWCEAIVQRVPEYVDGSDASATPSASNQEMGRRFVIVAFRWLNEGEI